MALLPSARGSGIARRRAAPPAAGASRQGRILILAESRGVFGAQAHQERRMAPAADDPRGPAPVPPPGEGEPSRPGSAGASGHERSEGPHAAGGDHLPPAAAPGVLAPTDAAAPPAAEGQVDAAEADALAGRASWFDRLWLTVRYYYVRALAQLRELRPGELNLSWVTDSLAVGGSFDPRDVPRLRAAGVTAVLDLRGEAVDDAEVLERNGINFLHLPTPDTYPPSQEHFERGVGWVLEQHA